MWPAFGPMREDTTRDRDLTGGHPTVPGDLDRRVYRMGNPSPGNGMPGIPRTRTGPRHGHGVPGNTPTGPHQPGAGYWDDNDI